MCNPVLTTKMIAAQLYEEHEGQGNRYSVATVNAMENALQLDDTQYVIFCMLE